MNVLFLGLITGIAFGYILYRAGVSRCGCIFDALNLLNLKAVKLMLTAVATGSLIVYPLAALGLVSIGGKTLYVLGVIAGGAIFGAGFALAGYCPGTALAALGAGRKDAWPAIIGGLFGAFAYSLVYDKIKPWLIDPLNYGRVSIPDLLGVNPFVTGIVFAGILIVAVYYINRWEASRFGASATSLQPAQAQSREPHPGRA